MVVAVVSVRMMQVAVDQVVGVVSVRHRLVAAARAMLMAGFMAFTSMVRRVTVGVLCRYRHGVIIDVTFVLVVEMAVVQVVGVAFVGNRGVAAVRSVLVAVVVVGMFVGRVVLGVGHLPSPRTGGEVKPLASLAGDQVIHVMVLGTTLRRSFQLQGDVLDAEVMGGDVPQASPQFSQVALKCGIDKDVTRKHVVAGREAPDVNVVDEGDAFYILDLTTEVVHIDVFGSAFEQHVNYFPKEAPCAEQDQDADNDTQDGVGERPSKSPDENA